MGNLLYNILYLTEMKNYLSLNLLNVVNLIFAVVDTCN